MSKLVLPVSIETIATRHDGSVKIVMGTYELNTQSSVKLFDLRKTECLMYLSSDNISQEELDALDGFKLDSEKTDGKTPSQRLRAVLFVYWKQHKQKEIEFDIFYVRYMNRLIEQIKEKLE
tara:strand:+ start:1346 stop:1708 length:363 start_codon:yes stop_codon:yes gene_type:complete